jgi:hypothetical protein
MDDPSEKGPYEPSQPDTGGAGTDRIYFFCGVIFEMTQRLRRRHALAGGREANKSDQTSVNNRALNALCLPLLRVLITLAFKVIRHDHDRGQPQFEKKSALFALFRPRRLTAGYGLFALF